MTSSMADFALGVARLQAALGPCAHPEAVPVELLLTGERVAWLCPGCDRQLPPDYWISLAERDLLGRGGAAS